MLSGHSLKYAVAHMTIRITFQEPNSGNAHQDDMSIEKGPEAYRVRV